MPPLSILFSPRAIFGSSTGDISYFFEDVFAWKEFLSEQPFFHVILNQSRRMALEAEAEEGHLDSQSLAKALGPSRPHRH